jgi:thiol-disulfide isomerase/thioredoxin
MNNIQFLKERSTMIRKALGLAILLTVGWQILSVLPFSPVSELTRADARGKLASPIMSSNILNPVQKPYTAPPIEGIAHWINSEPLTQEDLKGKVVLIDFWAYSCINCIRTLPYVKSWHEKYQHKGFEVIGIHAPEFSFEHSLSNVKNAVLKNGIHYPVALDNGFQTWRNFKNQYWPAHYLIDRSGKVVYTHFGEGNYDVTEHNIRALLKVNTHKIGNNSQDRQTTNYGKATIQQTPETYLGYNRAKNFASKPSLTANKLEDYSFPDFLPLNHWALQGKWKVESQKSVSQEKNAKLRINFLSKKVFLVLGSKNQQSIPVSLKLNNRTVSSQSTLNVKSHQLYTLLSLDSIQNGQLDIIAGAPGLEVYAFTFGS